MQLPKHINAVEVFAPEASLSKDSQGAATTMLVLLYRGSFHAGERKVRWHVSGARTDRRLATLIAMCDLLERLDGRLEARIYFQNPMTSDIARGDRKHAEVPGTALASEALSELMATARKRVNVAFDTATVHRSTSMTRAHKLAEAGDGELDNVFQIDVA